jgi:hypothetical protein
MPSVVLPTTLAATLASALLNPSIEAAVNEPGQYTTIRKSSLPERAPAQDNFWRLPVLQVLVAACWPNGLLIKTPDKPSCRCHDGCQVFTTNGSQDGRARKHPECAKRTKDRG